MASVNKVIIIGNMGHDPETRYMPNGDAVVNLRLATSRKWKDKAGDVQEETEWHSVVFYGRLAEVAGEYLKKGRPAYVEGRLRTRKWQDKDGADRFTTEIVGESLQLLGGNDRGSEGGGSRPPSEGSRAPASQRPAPRQAPAGGGMDDMDDDIPF